MKYKKLYIILFIILYVVVAFSSFFHSIEFFELSNHTWMGVILGLAFEIGQAAVLLSLLTTKQRKNIIAWILMFIFTIVQIIGNVYSSYKYILLHSSENLKYFKEPIFIWIDLPDVQTTVIVTYITSAILPICALLLTALVSNFLGKNETIKLNEEVTDEEDEDSDEDSDEIPQDLDDENPGYVSPYKEDVHINEDEEKHLEEDEEKHLEEDKDNNVSQIPSHSVNI